MDDDLSFSFLRFFLDGWFVDDSDDDDVVAADAVVVIEFIFNGFSHVVVTPL